MGVQPRRWQRSTRTMTDFTMAEAGCLKGCGGVGRPQRASARLRPGPERVAQNWGALLAGAGPMVGRRHDEMGANAWNGRIPPASHFCPGSVIKFHHHGRLEGGLEAAHFAPACFSLIRNEPTPANTDHTFRPPCTGLLMPALPSDYDMQQWHHLATLP